MKLNKKLIKKIIVIAVITLVVAVSLMLIGNQMRANAIKEQQEKDDYEEWLANNCECLARDRIFCPEGFELKGKMCYNDKFYTSRLAACSKYDCSGEIKLFNNQTETWQNQN